MKDEEKRGIKKNKNKNQRQQKEHQRQEIGSK